jgi:hypothetical protein
MVRESKKHHGNFSDTIVNFETFDSHLRGSKVFEACSELMIIVSTNSKNKFKTY